MEQRQMYNLGFVFNETFEKVLLIKLSKPGKWNDDLTNGIGGKMEEGETLIESMRRECYEETRLRITDWEKVGRFSGPKFEVFTFVSVIEENRILEYSSEEGLVQWYDVNNLPITLVPNAEWMIPLCINFKKSTVTDFDVYVNDDKLA